MICINQSSSLKLAPQAECHGNGECGEKVLGGAVERGREDVCGKGRVIAWARLQGAQHETG